MAYIAKHKDGWRAQVTKLGVRKTAVWPTKREAAEWASRLESEIVAGKHRDILGSHTVGDAVTKYAQEVSSKKDGKRWEVARLEVFKEHLGASTTLASIQSPQIANWRDTRLKVVSGSTVVREANLFKNLFNVARTEWRWIEHKPFDGVKMPAQAEPRQAVWGWRVIRKILRAPRVGKTAEMQKAFHIALRTGMRLGEVLAAPENYDPASRVVTLNDVVGARKTATIYRIPIGRIAGKLLEETKFTVNANEGSVLFSKLCRELLIEGLTFHDTRATALTHLAKKVPVEILAKISRHKDISLLVNVYYRPKAADISKMI